MLQKGEAAESADIITLEQALKNQLRPLALDEAGRKPARRVDPVCEQGSNEAHYALEGLPNKVLAAEYQTVLPNENLLAAELPRTKRELEARLGRLNDAGSSE